MDHRSRVGGYLSDYKLAVVEVQGELVWHCPEADEETHVLLSEPAGT